MNNKDIQDELIKKIREMDKLTDPNRLRSISMSELYDTVYTNKPAIIENFLYPGLCILAGDSKIGKSFLVSQIAFHIAIGKDFWNRTVKQGTVLYLALEDQYSRIQSRMFKMYGEENTDNLHFCVSAKPINDGLENQLTDFIKEHNDTNLIIIDTLQKVRGGTSDSYSYSKDYEFISQLKAFADRNGICLILVHHTKKDKDCNDPFNNVNGTNGLMGSADSTMILSKETRTSLSATLNITGRDQADTRIKIRKNPETLIWELGEFETEIYKEPPDPLFQKLTETVTQNGGQWSGNATELTALLDVNIAPNKLTLKLNISASKLRYDYGIAYQNIHTHDGRRIDLKLIKDNSATVGDDCDDKKECAV